MWPRFYAKIFFGAWKRPILEEMERLLEQDKWNPLDWHTGMPDLSPDAPVPPGWHDHSHPDKETAIDYVVHWIGQMKEIHEGIKSIALIGDSTTCFWMGYAAGNWKQSQLEFKEAVHASTGVEPWLYSVSGSSFIKHGKGNWGSFLVQAELASTHKFDAVLLVGGWNEDDGADISELVIEFTKKAQSLVSDPELAQQVGA